MRTRSWLSGCRSGLGRGPGNNLGAASNKAAIAMTNATTASVLQMTEDRVAGPLQVSPPSEWVCSPHRNPEGGVTGVDGDDLSPADWYCANYTWADVLGRTTGPSARGTVSKTVVSGVTRQRLTPIPPPLSTACYLFTQPPRPSTRPVGGVDNPHGYTRFRAFALLDWANDLSAAAIAAIDMGAPRSDPGPSLIETWEQFKGQKELGMPTSTEGTGPGHGSTLITASQVQRETVAWRWRGRIAAGKTCLFDGDPRVSKSTLTLALASIIRR
jgi:hypothetical protein